MVKTERRLFWAMIVLCFMTGYAARIIVERVLCPTPVGAQEQL